MEVIKLCCRYDSVLFFFFSRFPTFSFDFIFPFFSIFYFFFVDQLRAEFFTLAVRLCCMYASSWCLLFVGVIFWILKSHVHVNKYTHQAHTHLYINIHTFTCTHICLQYDDVFKFDFATLIRYAHTHTHVHIQTPAHTHTAYKHVQRCNMMMWSSFILASGAVDDDCSMLINRRTIRCIVIHTQSLSLTHTHHHSSLILANDASDDTVDNDTANKYVRVYTYVCDDDFGTRRSGR